MSPVRMVHNVRHTLLSAILLALLFVSCAPHAQRQTATVQFQDDYGRSVEVPEHPHRVVSLSPAVTEILYALGADTLLVGRTDFCTYPAAATALPSVGGISNLNIEQVVSLQPDLVISGSMIPQKTTQHLEELGVPVVCIIEKQHFDALYDNILAIGILVGHARQADSLVAALREKATLFTATHDATGAPDEATSPHNAARPTCYYVVGYGGGGNYTAGGNTFINDIIQMAGGQNIAADIQGWSYSLEALLAADPDYIIIRSEDSAAFATMPPYNRLTAVRGGHIIALESGIVDLQVPRNLDAIRQISKRIKDN